MRTAARQALRPRGNGCRRCRRALQASRPALVQRGTRREHATHSAVDGLFGPAQLNSNNNTQPAPRASHDSECLALPVQSSWSTFPWPAPVGLARRRAVAAAWQVRAEAEGHQNTPNMFWAITCYGRPEGSVVEQAARRVAHGKSGETSLPPPPHTAASLQQRPRSGFARGFEPASAKFVGLLVIPEHQAKYFVRPSLRAESLSVIGHPSPAPITISLLDS